MSEWRKYTRKEYTIAQLAYMAGIMDGEGCFFIGNYSRSKFTNDKHYQTSITVSNTSKVLIDWLQLNFGGLVNEYSRAQTPKNSLKKVYRWVASGERLTHLCEEILPYLTSKKRECEIMIEMRRTFERKITKKGVQGTIRIEPEILETRQCLFDELRSLHCRSHVPKQIN